MCVHSSHQQESIIEEQTSIQTSQTRENMSNYSNFVIESSRTNYIVNTHLGPGLWENIKKREFTVYIMCIYIYIEIEIFDRERIVLMIKLLNLIIYTISVYHNIYIKKKILLLIY